MPVTGVQTCALPISFAWEREIQRGELVLDSLSQAEESDHLPAAILESAKFFLHDQVKWHEIHRTNPIEAATGA